MLFVIRDRLDANSVVDKSLLNLGQSCAVFLALFLDLRGAILLALDGGGKDAYQTNRTPVVARQQNLPFKLVGGEKPPPNVNPASLPELFSRFLAALER